ncbi:MAG TPA: ATP-dependent RecD-like DNA helicase [Clostridia bacterium]|nr:ATP-dependent RecD-like DNA helicase [Clostridia bacterium]
MEVHGLEGTIKYVVFQSPDEEFTVARFQTAGETVTVVGALYGIRREQQLRIWGRRKSHPKYGPQIEVTRYEKPLPAGKEQIIDYLTTTVKSVGVKLAHGVVEALGEDCLKIILEQGPDVLTKIRGIGVKKAEQIHKSLVENLELQYVMLELLPFGVSASLVHKAYRNWGYSAIIAIKTNPYLLAEISPIGFYRADVIAENLELQPDSPYRLQAALKHVLLEAEGNGHCYLLADELLVKAKQALQMDENSLQEKLSAALEMMTLNRETVREGDRVYLQRLHEDEWTVAAKVRKLCYPKPFASERQVQSCLDSFEEESRLTLAPEQKEAVRKALHTGLFILTGGPGTGKTLTVSAVINVLRRLQGDATVLLASPTGRAGQNLAEVTGEEAGTIHRLLNFRPGEGPEYDESKPLECDLLVVDEVSMLDITLAGFLFDAVDPVRTRVLLVGDADQLPSVGPGNVLSDLIQAGVPAMELKHIFRQAAESQIVTNAHRVNQGEYIQIDREKGDFFLLEQEQIDKIARLIVASALRFLKLDYELQDLQVLSPMHKGPIGTIALNRRLQEALNPPEPGKKQISFGELIYREGDRVMQLKNNYHKQVFNGDTGVLESIVPENREDGQELTLWVRIRGTLVEYSREEALEELALAYCITVHKAQGGEVPIIIMPLSTAHYIMLARNLLYTGITRAKEKVVLVGTNKALRIAISNNRTAYRNSGLIDRIKLNQ